MIVYRVLSGQDILSGKAGKTVSSIDAAMIIAREVADSTKREASIFKYNTDTKGSEFVASVKAHSSAKRSASQSRTQSQVDHDIAMASIKRKQEEMRRKHEKFMKEQHARHAEYMRKYRDYAAQKQPKPVRTKYMVAMDNLNLKEGFDLSTLKLHYRTAAKKYHPDLGGNSEQFRWITRSYQYILETKGWKS